MPFTYTKKTNRVPIPKDVVERAAKEVVDLNCKLRTTANKYGIDKMTLKRYAAKYREQGVQANFQPNFKKSQIFSDEEEANLAQYFVTAGKMNYGLTPKECRKLSYLYATENGKAVPVYWKNNEEASYDWFRGFMKRNRNLSIRRPEPTSLSRATAFNKHTVSQFFELLREVLEREQFEPNSVYNCDETGVQTAHKPGSIVSQRGLKQVSKATSAERGQTVTVCCAVNAMGNFVPPFFVFPRVKKQDYMTYGAPVGSVAVTHPSGWMTVENFLVYLEHFAKHVKCTPDNKVLLLMDNHSSHISPQGLNFCKKNGIVLLTIPPHTSHRLQPLDVSTYGPFKAYFNSACDNYLVNHPGETITLKNVAELVGIAFDRAFTPTNIKHGFAKAGIQPFNPQVFGEEEFMSSEVTNRPETIQGALEIAQNNIERTPPQNTPPNDDQPNLHEDVSLENDANLLNIKPGPSGLNLKSPEEIRPLPKAPPRKNARRGTRKSKILTDTPNMKEIEDVFLMKKQRVNPQSVKKVISFDKENPIESMQKKTKNNVSSDSSSDDESIHTSTSSEFTDVEEDMKNQEQEDNFAKGIIKKNDYVLVKFCLDKSVRHYVGLVENTMEEEMFYVTFMRRNKPGYSFVYPIVPDKSIVPASDTKRLPPPVLSGGTARMHRKLTFPVNFDKYINVM